MKKLFTIVILLAVLTSFSQARIGFHYKDIEKEMNASVEKDSRGIYYLFAENNNVFTKYYFDDGYYCNYCMVIPKTVGSVNYLIEYNNANFVIINDRSWKWYTSGSIIGIYLLYNEEYETYYFDYWLE